MLCKFTSSFPGHFDLVRTQHQLPKPDNCSSCSSLSGKVVTLIQNTHYKYSPQVNLDSFQLIWNSESDGTWRFAFLSPWTQALLCRNNKVHDIQKHAVTKTVKNMTVENLLCGWHVVANIRKNNQYMDLASDNVLSLQREKIIREREREIPSKQQSPISFSLPHVSMGKNSSQISMSICWWASKIPKKKKEGRSMRACSNSHKKEIQFSARSNC
jgi:hypothetical protein